LAPDTPTPSEEATPPPVPSPVSVDQPNWPRLIQAGRWLKRNVGDLALYVGLAALAVIFAWVDIRYAEPAGPLVLATVILAEATAILAAVSAYNAHLTKNLNANFALILGEVLRPSKPEEAPPATPAPPRPPG
jgi:hypothetical protein